ncbi:fanconi-associated nuclease 1 homolog isoform X2 [Rhododendron vialii]|uniref:fanconi-associated nuclease 1 homolog isoform X2 n=1 Tax=Rhododendron vialii TaxID=182163 RepID=UPI00265F8F72|nr:fanconi-associated nuclease 1 homolog isoform X2 [Rhododendron vialii]
MLTGRESLIRLIGKRRRFLPNRQSLLSSPSQGSLDLRKGENVGEMTVAEEGSSEKHLGGGGDNDRIGSVVETCAADFVTCPVCGNTVPGGDYMINSHLDTCLARGTKRKLRQRTLLQLNFSSQSKVGIQSSELDQVGVHLVQRAPDNILCDTIRKLHDCVGANRDNTTQCKALMNSESVLSTDSSAENKITYDINCGADSPTLLPENKMPKYEMNETMDDMSGQLLKTFVVGRKFSEEVMLYLGANISLLRDPNNIKDSNAIKVVYAESGCYKMLGFIPRELAQYLSPLMDKYLLSFEGCVTSIPEHSHDVLPIQITCQNEIFSGEKECDNLQVVRSLWENAFRVAESAKTHPLGMAKYQQNFSVLIQEVLRSYPHLFSCDEKIIFETFTSLSDDSQRLFVRLYTRKGPWFRISNLSYPEISDYNQAIKELSATGYMCAVESISDLQDNDLKEVLYLLTVSELREVLCKLKKKCKPGTRKQDFVALLLSSYADGLCPVLPNVVLEKTGPCVQISLSTESIIWRAERLFFLNGEQDLSAFLLVDLGIIKYPNYNCIISKQIFSSRDDFLAYEEAIEVAQVMDQSLDENSTEFVWRCIEVSDSRISNSSHEETRSLTSESPAAFLSCFSAAWVYSKVVLLGVSFLERERRYKDAIILLKQLLKHFTSDRRRGYWTLRLSIDLEHVGCLNESLSVAEDGLLDPSVRAGSRMALQRRVLRLGKPPRRWKTPSFSESVKRKITEVHVQGRPLNCRTGTKSRFYGEDGEQCGVEELAMQYYGGEGGSWQSVHTESGIWLTIFGLLLWDAIFADVPDVFRTRFQTAPLDLGTDSFYEVRKTILEPILVKIYDGAAEEILITSWETHLGTSCRGVNWDRHSLSELRAAVTCIGGPCLASFCRHLAQDYRTWSSGMPDLLLWRFHGDYRGEAKLVEVKGPNDRLSEQQRAWLLFLMDCGFNTEVCKVSPAPVSE